MPGYVRMLFGQSPCHVARIDSASETGTSALRTCKRTVRNFFDIEIFKCLGIILIPRGIFAHFGCICIGLVIIDSLICSLTEC